MELDFAKLMTYLFGTEVNLKVIISCFGDFKPGTGGGNTAFQISQYLHSQGVLESVLCMGYDKAQSGTLTDYAIQVVPKRSIEKIVPSLIGRAELLFLGTIRFGRIIAEKAFDKASVQYLTETDILHCIKPVVPRTIKEAKRLGIITTTQTATCHARFNKEMIDMERKMYGLPCIDTYCDETRVWRMEEVYENVDYITTWYDFVAQTFIDKGVPKEKICVLHVPLGFKEPVYIKREPKGKLEVLYAAHTNLLKGLHYLLGAWENHKLYKIGRLTVCGDIDANTRKIIRRKKWDLQNVDFVGRVNMGPYYEQADVVVVPSLSEGDSAVPREAMAYGIPVIVTEHCGNREIVEKFETGFVVPVRSEEAIAQAIIELHESQALRQHFGENGRRATSQFTWRNYSHRLFEEFERMVEYA